MIDRIRSRACRIALRDGQRAKNLRCTDRAPAVVEPEELQPLAFLDQVHNPGLRELGFQPELAQQDRQPRQRGLGLRP